MKILKYLLIPFSLIYGLAVVVRNKLYDFGFLPSKEFKIGIIAVGNLTVGGTGKTPMTEYLIRLLQKNYAVAMLSRGYERNTSGFILASENSSAAEIGDEPRQIKRKFKKIPVAVDENRVNGVKKLLSHHATLDTIILDDAFQHRAIKPGKSILLIDYNTISKRDFLLPAGRLRELPSAKRRADIIVVTKTPENFLPLERRLILSDIKVEPYQSIYFSYIKYGNFIPFNSDVDAIALDKSYYLERNYAVLLFTGIENAAPLEEYLKKMIPEFTSIRFFDHHEYTPGDITKIQKTFETIASENKIIVTTEKDARRLELSDYKDMLGELPLFYIPIETVFHPQDAEVFNKQITEYARTNQYSKQLQTSGPRIRETV